jgi:hypothetical protein
LSEDRYSDKVKEGVKKKYPHPEEEIAVIRKAVARIFEIISTLHEGEINNAEFVEYNAIVEQIKAATREDMKNGGG